MLTTVCSVGEAYLTAYGSDIVFFVNKKLIPFATVYAVYYNTACIRVTRKKNTS